MTGGTVAVDGRLLVRAVSVGCGHPPRTHRAAGRGRAGGQEPRAAAGRPNFGRVRADRDRAGRPDARRVARARPAARRGIHRRRCGADHRVPVRARTGDPVAILVGTGRGAQLGVLITGPEAVESAQPHRHRADRQDRYPHDQWTHDGARGRRCRAASTRARPCGSRRRSRPARSIRSRVPSSRTAIGAAASFPRARTSATTRAAGSRASSTGRRAFAGSPAFALEQARCLLPADLDARPSSVRTAARSVVAGWAGSGARRRSSGLRGRRRGAGPGAPRDRRRLREHGLERRAAHGRRRRRRARRRRTGGHRRGRRGRAARGQARRGGASAGARASRRDGRRRRERCRRSRRGRPRDRDGRRDGCAMHASDITLVRNDRASIVTALRLPPHDGDDPGQPVLGIRRTTSRRSRSRRWGCSTP